MPKGLFDKYKVEKKDGKTDPNADYFVLRLDTDRNARSAALHYASCIKDRNPQLAHDLTKAVFSYEGVVKLGD